MSNLEELPQYPLTRDEFKELFAEISELLYYENSFDGENFKYWRNEDEFYILHYPSGTILNWYKHLGRTNTCNKALTREEYKEFATMFINEVLGKETEENEQM